MITIARSLLSSIPFLVLLLISIIELIKLNESENKKTFSIIEIVLCVISYVYNSAFRMFVMPNMGGGGKFAHTCITIMSLVYIINCILKKGSDNKNFRKICIIVNIILIIIIIVLVFVDLNSIANYHPEAVSIIR